MIKDFLVWLHYKGSPVWLFYILAFEFFVATNLSTTILTDYPFLSAWVDAMSFMPAINNFDRRAIHPEAVKFYIAFAVWLVMPKSIAIYYLVKNSPENWAQELIITPLTTNKPPRITITQRFSAEKVEIDKLPTVKRSRVSAIFWSLMTLLFTTMIIFIWVFNTGFSNTSEYVQSMHNRVGIGGAAMWFQLSFKQMTFAALLMSVAIVIIKDYLVFFKLIINRK
jgi:hypothetical protein